jgi:hypothetical protein
MTLKRSRQGCGPCSALMAWIHLMERNMSNRRTWTPAELRDLSRVPMLNDISIGNMRGALAYAADVIESADRVIAEYTNCPRCHGNAGVPGNQQEGGNG